MEDAPSRKLMNRAIGVIADAERICREASERVEEGRRIRDDATAIRRDPWFLRPAQPMGRRTLGD